MTAPTPDRHHTMAHVGFNAPDLAVAKAFDTAVFGWPFTEHAPFDFPGGRRSHLRDPGSDELVVWTQN